MSEQVKVEVIRVLNRNEKRRAFLNESRRQALVIAQKHNAKTKENKIRYAKRK